LNVLQQGECLTRHITGHLRDRSFEAVSSMVMTADLKTTVKQNIQTLKK